MKILQPLDIARMGSPKKRGGSGEIPPYFLDTFTEAGTVALASHSPDIQNAEWTGYTTLGYGAANVYSGGYVRGAVDGTACIYVCKPYPGNNFRNVAKVIQKYKARNENIGSSTEIGLCHNAANTGRHYAIKAYTGSQGGLNTSLWEKSATDTYLLNVNHGIVGGAIVGVLLRQEFEMDWVAGTIKRTIFNDTTDAQLWTYTYTLASPTIHNKPYLYMNMANAIWEWHELAVYGV